MNRSALQFTLRAWFVAGAYSAVFTVCCAGAMWFCWAEGRRVISDGSRLSEAHRAHMDSGDIVSPPTTSKD